MRINLEKSTKIIYRILYSIVLILIFIIAIYSAYFFSQKKKYSSFELDRYLNPEELVFQSINFNKFIVYGTDDKRITANTYLGNYTDEMQVYFIKGTVDISLGNELKTATIDWAKTDMIKKNLCLMFDLSDSKEIFKTNVRVSSKDFYLVTNLESQEMLKMDLVKNKNPDEMLLKVKADLEQEFSKQVNSSNIKNTEEFKAFEESLEKIICSQNQDKWKSVSVSYKF